MKSNIPSQLILQKNSSLPLYQGGLYLYDVILTFPAQNMENTMTIFNNFGSIQSTISITYPQQIVLSNVDFSQITFQDDSEYDYYIYATIKVKKYESREEWEQAKENADMSINPIPYTSTPKFAFGSIQTDTVSSTVYPNQAYCIPITITNSQGVAIGTNFPVLISFTPSQLSSYINPNCQNIAFYDSHGNKLQSWIENATQSTTSGQVNIWVNLGSNNINPNSSITIYMAIANSTSVNYLSASGPAGANPLYTSTYGQYDNGANVFSFYRNFAGTTLDSSWSVPSGASLSQNNGLTVSVTARYNQYFVTYNYTITLPAVIEGYVYYNPYTSGGYTNYMFGIGMNTQSGAGNSQMGNGVVGVICNPNYCKDSNGTVTNMTVQEPFVNTYLSTAVPEGNSAFGPHIWSLALTSSYASFTDSLHTLSGSYSAPTTSGYYAFYFSNNNQGKIASLNWIRVRTYPPNGVMPSISFGNLIPIGQMSATIEPVVSGNIYFDFVIQNVSSSAQTFTIINQNTNTTIINETIPANSVVEIEAYDYNQPLNQVIQYFSNQYTALYFYTAICRETF
jgi:hypothetical protein